MIVLGHHLTWMWLAVLALATFRVTRFIVADQFPGWAALRSRIEARGKHAGYFVGCPWCVGVWVAAAVMTWWLLWPAGLAPVAVILALAAVAGVLAEWSG